MGRPDHLRGALSRWTTEFAPGIFVGTVSARVRHELLQAVTDIVGTRRRVPAVRIS
ncbi:type I-E CRISPR-associated endoribonuclease Cas2 [Streptomyces sp. NPDC060366]|uniref:type I-E CRISPR-associated endoribonuclease Cas2 n=1 Tax=Streptomyces sp. NPDC060366 TaxID=3347105 RepID=UPI0036611703